MGLEWLKRRKPSHARVALCPCATGVALAAVSHAGNGQPVLEWTDFLATGAGPTRADQLQALLNNHKLAGAPASGLLPLGNYNLQLIEAPDVPAAELRAAVRWRVKDLIDFDIDDAVVDVVEVPPLKGGRDNMLYAVIARRAAVMTIIEEIEAAEVALDVVDIPEFALRNLAALIAEDVAGVALIYLDDDSGIITITRQQKLFLSRRIDIGRQRLLASGADTVTAELEGVLDGIVIEVQRSLDYYESQFAQPPVQGIVIAPLGGELAGVDSYLGSQLGVSARMLDLGELLEQRTPIAAADAGRCLMAVGAALRSAETPA